MCSKLIPHLILLLLMVHFSSVECYAQSTSNQSRANQDSKPSFILDVEMGIGGIGVLEHGEDNARVDHGPNLSSAISSELSLGYRFRNSSLALKTGLRSQGFGQRFQYDDQEYRFSGTRLSVPLLVTIYFPAEDEEFTALLDFGFYYAFHTTQSLLNIPANERIDDPFRNFGARAGGCNLNSV